MRTEVLPRFNVQCPQCRHVAPRSDGVPCKLCAPQGHAGLTFTDLDTGITHRAMNACSTCSTRRASPLNVDDVPVTCMACIAELPDLW